MISLVFFALFKSSPEENDFISMLDKASKSNDPIHYNINTSILFGFYLSLVKVDNTKKLEALSNSNLYNSNEIYTGKQNITKLGYFILKRLFYVANLLPMKVKYLHVNFMEDVKGTFRYKYKIFIPRHNNFLTQFTNIIANEFLEHVKIDLVDKRRFFASLYEYFYSKQLKNTSDISEYLLHLDILTRFSPPKLLSNHKLIHSTLAEFKDKNLEEFIDISKKVIDELDTVVIVKKIKAENIKESYLNVYIDSTQKPPGTPEETTTKSNNKPSPPTKKQKTKDLRDLVNKAKTPTKKQTPKEEKYSDPDHKYFISSSDIESYSTDSEQIKSTKKTKYPSGTVKSKKPTKTLNTEKAKEKVLTGTKTTNSTSAATNKHTSNKTKNPWKNYILWMGIFAVVVLILVGGVLAYLAMFK